VASSDEEDGQAGINTKISLIGSVSSATPYQQTENESGR
jgi:hypothetical protein